MKPTIAVVLLVSGCASYVPVIDMQGVDHGRYQSDLAQCQQYAHQVSPGNHAAAGAAGGAAIGAILGALLGNRQTVGQAAGAYAVLGGAAGAAHGGDAQINVIRNCMSGRGYRVLQ